MKIIIWKTDDSNPIDLKIHRKMLPMMNRIYCFIINY